jgi:hypothetical protein
MTEGSMRKSLLKSLQVFAGLHKSAQAYAAGLTGAPTSPRLFARLLFVFLFPVPAVWRNFM